ncbi:MAG: hypothetical protein L6Q94_23590, partial [Calditrichia bacterium]|nr:hypothetical protein [Calditrichia bacterium]
MKFLKGRSCDEQTNNRIFGSWKYINWASERLANACGYLPKEIIDRLKKEYDHLIGKLVAMINKSSHTLPLPHSPIPELVHRFAGMYITPGNVQMSYFLEKSRSIPALRTQCRISKITSTCPWPPHSKTSPFPLHTS